MMIDEGQRHLTIQNYFEFVRKAKKWVFKNDRFEFHIYCQINDGY